MKSLVLAAVVVAGTASVSSALTVTLIDDFGVANTNLLTLGAPPATSATLTDTGLDPTRVIGGTREIVYGRDDGTAYRGLIRPVVGIGPNDSNVNVLQEVAPSDFAPRLTLSYGTTDNTTFNFSGIVGIDFVVASYDGPIDQPLQVVVTLAGPAGTVAVNGAIAATQSNTLYSVSTASVSPALLAAVDTVRFQFTGPRGADFALQSISTAIPEPTGVAGLLIPAVALLGRRRKQSR